MCDKKCEGECQQEEYEKLETRSNDRSSLASSPPSTYRGAMRCHEPPMEEPGDYWETEVGEKDHENHRLYQVHHQKRALREACVHYWNQDGTDEPGRDDGDERLLPFGDVGRNRGEWCGSQGMFPLRTII